jgi:hypothetical protein
MQTAGTVLQLMGAMVAALGFFYAWKRASAGFDQWRDSVDQWRNSAISRLRELREQVTHKSQADAGSSLIAATDI